MFKRKKEEPANIVEGAKFYDAPENSHIGDTYDVPTMLIKDSNIVDMTFTKWVLKDKGGTVGFDIQSGRLDVHDDVDKILFELPIGCFVIEQQAAPGEWLTFGGASPSVPIRECNNRGEMQWTTTPSESHVTAVTEPK